MLDSVKEQIRDKGYGGELVKERQVIQRILEGDRDHLTANIFFPWYDTAAWYAEELLEYLIHYIIWILNQNMYQSSDGA